MTDHAGTPTSHPLTWPLGWKRTGAAHRSRSRFGDKPLSQVSKVVLAELGRLGVRSGVVISTNVSLRRDGLPYSNQRRPEDPGAAVYFQFKGQPRVLACDRWLTPEENLVAIAKHIEALRGQDRWGVGSLEQAFSGYQALPPPPDIAPHWSTVLGVSPSATSAEIRAAYTERVVRAHPDHGGSVEELGRVRAAWAAARSAGLVSDGVGTVQHQREMR